MILIQRINFSGILKLCFSQLIAPDTYSLYIRESSIHSSPCIKSSSFKNMVTMTNGSLIQGTLEPRFTNKFSEQKTSRMTNGVSDYEHASWQQRLATSWEYRSGSVSYWLTLAQYTSLLEFTVPSLEFHCVLCFLNILLNKTPWDQRRIKCLPTVKVFLCWGLVFITWTGKFWKQPMVEYRKSRTYS
jgi:hypothetical protein